MTKFPLKSTWDIFCLDKRSASGETCSHLHKVTSPIQCSPLLWDLLGSLVKCRFCSQNATSGSLLVAMEWSIESYGSSTHSILQETSDVGKKCFPLSPRKGDPTRPCLQGGLGAREVPVRSDCEGVGACGCKPRPGKGSDSGAHAHSEGGLGGKI